MRCVVFSFLFSGGCAAGDESFRISNQRKFYFKKRIPPPTQLGEGTFTSTQTLNYRLKRNVFVSRLGSVAISFALVVVAHAFLKWLLDGTRQELTALLSSFIPRTHLPLLAVNGYGSSPVWSLGVCVVFWEEDEPLFVIVLHCFVVVYLSSNRRNSDLNERGILALGHALASLIFRYQSSGSFSDWLIVKNKSQSCSIALDSLEAPSELS